MDCPARAGPGLAGTGGVTCELLFLPWEPLPCAPPTTPRPAQPHPHPRPRPPHPAARTARPQNGLSVPLRVTTYRGKAPIVEYAPLGLPRSPVVNVALPNMVRCAALRWAGWWWSRLLGLCRLAL